MKNREDCLQHIEKYSKKGPFVIIDIFNNVNYFAVEMPNLQFVVRLQSQEHEQLHNEATNIIVYKESKLQLSIWSLQIKDIQFESLYSRVEIWKLYPVAIPKASTKAMGKLVYLGNDLQNNQMNANNVAKSNIKVWTSPSSKSKLEYLISLSKLLNYPPLLLTEIGFMLRNQIGVFKTCESFLDLIADCRLLCQRYFMNSMACLHALLASLDYPIPWILSFCRCIFGELCRISLVAKQFDLAIDIAIQPAMLFLRDVELNAIVGRCAASSGNLNLAVVSYSWTLYLESRFQEAIHFFETNNLSPLPIADERLLTLHYTKHKSYNKVQLSTPKQQAEPVEVKYGDHKKVIEKIQFSKSVIWQLLKQYYSEQGMDAWTMDNLGKRDDQVPHYMTSNHTFVQEQVGIVYAALLDFIKLPSFNSTQPIYIIDLGSGNGQFIVRFLLALAHLLQRNTSFKENRFSVFIIASDLTESSFSCWSNEEIVKPYLPSPGKENQLCIDFAKIDGTTSFDSLSLKLSKTVISKYSILNPLIIIANYYFDSLPCDIIRCEKHDSTMSVSLAEVVHWPPEDSKEYAVDFRIGWRDLHCIQREFHFNEICRFEYGDVIMKVAEDPETQNANATLTDSLLQYCRKMLQSEVVTKVNFTWPVAGINFMSNIGELSASQELFMLIADKAERFPWCLTFGSRMPKIECHGSFSLPVNVDALADYIVSCGSAAAIFNPFYHQPLDHSYLLYGLPLNTCRVLESALHISLQYTCDIFNLRDHIEDSYGDCQLPNEAIQLIFLLASNDQDVVHQMMLTTEEKL